MAYVKDYTGRNLGDIGYISMGGDLRDYYGMTNLKLIVITDDGSYVDVKDEASLKQYYVIRQNPSPNTAMTFEYETDSEGYEYSFTKWQSLSEIELHVARTEEPDSVNRQAESSVVQEPVEKTPEETVKTSSASAEYEAVFNDYSVKLRDAATVYIQEYHQERQSNTDGIAGLAGIANDKVIKLAEISNEGVSELAKVYYSSSGSYEEYSDWAEKLYDVYMEEADRIYDEYMNSLF